MNIELANRLIQLRKDHHFSQEELAEKLGISRQAISKWERAESSPDTDNLILLSQLYQISIDELLLLTKNKQPADSLTPQQLKTEDASSPAETPVTSKSKILYILDGVYPILVSVIYLAIGFIFNKWHPGWLIFLTIPIYYGITDSLAKAKD